MATATVAQGTPSTIGSPALNAPGFVVGAFGRSVVADLTGHQLPDVVMLATESGGALRETALLVAAPGVHKSAVLLRNVTGKKIRDVAVLRGGDPAHDRDAILLATDQGLYSWCSDGRTTRYGGQAWNHATRVEVGDVNGDGVPDAIGKMGSDTAGNPQNVRATPIGDGTTWFVDTGATVLDLAVVDWITQHGAPRDEIAVVHSNAVHFVVDGAIDPALTVTLPLCSTAKLVAIRAADGTPRLVAGLTDATGASVLATITPGSPVVAFRPVGRPIGGLTVVQNGPAADGVVVAIAENANLLHFTYDPATFPAEGFDFGATLRSAATPANGASDGRLLDLDGDGDLDMIAPKVGTGVVVQRTAGPAAGTDGRPILMQVIGNDFQFQLPPWATHFETLHYQFTAVRGATGITGMTMAPECLARPISPAATTFQPHENWPAVGDTATGPVATLVRAVERQGTTTLRRGPFRVMVWAKDDADRDFMASLLGSSLLQPVVFANHANTPGNLVYGAFGPGDIIVFPSTETGTEAPEEGESTQAPLACDSDALASATAPASQPGSTTATTRTASLARVLGILLGIVPGAVEPPDLPPPDGDEPPEGDDPNGG